MESVNIKREELLAKVSDNRKAHALDYEEAMVGYRVEAIKKLTEMLEAAQAGGEIKTNANLTQPVTRLDDYDKVIAMLEMSVDDTIKLDQSDFARYVLDKWEWKLAASLANGMYKSHA